jgi:tetratricopeptide (TPR) repeat protein
MKFNHKIYPLLAAGFAAMGLTACNDDDFLEEDARTIYTTDNSYETVDQVKACVTNLYVHVRYWYDCNSFLKGLGADVADTPYWRCSGNGYGNFANWSSTSNNSNQIFNAMYQLVNYANQSLAGFDVEGLSWASAAEKNEAYGEMMFMRGYGYLRLGEMFGGVPLVTEFYQGLKLDFERSTREQTYEQAIADLKLAADNLPDYPSEAGRVAKGAAYHFLSEAYIALATIKNNDASDLTTAISYADKVIAMHPIMTERFGTRATQGAGPVRNSTDAYFPEGNVFFDLFQMGNADYCEGNTEALWTLEWNYDLYHEYGGNNTNFPREWCPVLRDAYWNDENALGTNGPWTGNIDASLYPGTNQSTYVGGRAVSFYAPTSYVINDIWEGNNWNDMRNDSVNIRRNFVCINQDHPMYGKVVSADMLSTERIDRFYPVWTKWCSIDEYNWDDLSEGWQRSASYWDTYACRSAETVLLRAEAKLRKGDKSGAASDVNILRKRAQCDHMAQESEMDIQYILDERARELFFEEQRWATLLRMGQDGINSINNHAMYIASQQKAWRDRVPVTTAPISGWTLFPIPQTVIDTNSGATIEQNPGWN